MKNIITKTMLAYLLVYCCQTAFAQGYNIKIKINGLSDTTLILGHHLNKSMYPDDTTWIDKNGNGTFKGPDLLPGGLYVIFLPSTKYFQILLDKDQEFSIETDTSDFVHSIKIKGSEDNEVFYDFQKYMVSISKQAEKLQEKIKDAANDKEKNDLRKQLGKIGDDRIDRIKETMQQYPNHFISVFLKATLDIEVPEAPILENGKKDSAWQYFYYRDHYFDNFNISDPRLLRTPLYEDKIITYVTKVIPQVPDSMVPYVDNLIEKSRVDSNLFRYMMITLFNHFAKSNIMGMDAIYVHIADKYYINESWWSDKKFIDDLKERVEKAKPLLIGKIAPDMQLVHVPTDHFIAAENDTAIKRYPHIGTHFNMHQVEAKYLVLAFWEADCGHCKKAIPKLYEEFENKLNPKGIKVIAISTLFGEEGKMKWVDFVNKHKLYDWINAWNPYSYEYKIKYDISSTPQFFVLDENKKIIAKRIGVEQIDGIIDAFEKLKKNE